MHILFAYSLSFHRLCTLWKICAASGTWTRTKIVKENKRNGSEHHSNACMCRVHNARLTAQPRNRTLNVILISKCVHYFEQKLAFHASLGVTTKPWVPLLVTFYFPHIVASGPDPGYNETFMIGCNTIQRLFCLLR